MFKVTLLENIKYQFYYMQYRGFVHKIWYNDVHELSKQGCPRVYVIIFGLKHTFVRGDFGHNLNEYYKKKIRK